MIIINQYYRVDILVHFDKNKCILYQLWYKISGNLKASRPTIPAIIAQYCRYLADEMHGPILVTKKLDFSKKFLKKNYKKKKTWTFYQYRFWTCADSKVANFWWKIGISVKSSISAAVHFLRSYKRLRIYDVNK